MGDTQAYNAITIVFRFFCGDQRGTGKRIHLFLPYTSVTIHLNHRPSLRRYPADLVHCPAAVALGGTLVGESVADGQGHLAAVESILVVGTRVTIHHRISRHVLVEKIINRQRGAQLVLDDIPVHAHRETGPVAPFHSFCFVREHGPVT